MRDSTATGESVRIVLLDEEMRRMNLREGKAAGSFRILND
jgi:hypothetical protein